MTMKKILASVGNMLFPNLCVLCNNYLAHTETILCDHCTYTLPKLEESGTLDRIFWGRAKIEYSHALLHFKSGNSIQKLLHHIKYKNNQELAIIMGRMMAQAFLSFKLFEECDTLIPVPLHIKKMRKRGYNQSSLLAKGINEILKKELLDNLLIRTRSTETQTKKTRYNRFENMKNVFKVIDKSLIENKHVVLIDDVITTGATLEGCIYALQKESNCKVSICCLAASQ